MAYTTVEDWTITYPRLADTRVNSSTMYKYIMKACDFIDASIIDVVASVPVTPTPPLLQGLSEDLAYYMFLKRHVKEAGSDSGVVELGKEVMLRLENIRNGVISIVGSGGVDLSTSNRNSNPWSSVENYTPTFGVSDIDDATIDEDRIGDESDERDS